MSASSENGMPDVPPTDERPAQAQLYDDLRRIGQLEDQKQAIQLEIDQKTARLRDALPHLNKDSLLFQMLDAAMNKTADLPAQATAQSPRPPATRKKTTRRKR